MVAAMSNSASLALHALGLIVIYSGYSLYQEKIMKSSYGPDQVRFTSSAILVLCNRLFSMMVGFCLIAIKSARSDPADHARSSFRARIRPQSPLFAYAAVAACNFAATFCQYEALRHVGFTTQALAKCCKMAPVLFVGRIVYKRKHNAKSWVAASVVAFGCAVYLFSSSPAGSKASAEAAVSFMDGLMGTVLILGYLFFDGLTSTTQERVFGRAPTSTDPFGPDSPVLDQMIFVNIFAILISLVASAATIFTTLIPSLALIASSPMLALDILGLSATSACGLIVLLNTIAAFGALTSSTIMTVRQFLSIITNAGVFGNFSSVGAQGWTGIFWVAGGIFIKMDRRWDEPKQPKRPVVVVHDEEETELFDAEKALSTNSSPTRPAPGTPLPPYEPVASNVAPPTARKPSPLRQYGPPLVVPLLLGIVTALATGDVPKLPSLPSLAGVESYEPETLEAVAEEPADVADVDVDTVALENTVAVVEGGQWSKQLHSAVDPSCPDMVQTAPYKGKIARTALATFPRSGNSYIRSMFERATGFQTSSMYCDRVLELAFKGECDHKANFLVKTHYPSVRTWPNNSPSHWADFDRVLHVVRNPLDAIYSYHMWRTHHHDHEHTEDATKPLGLTGFEQKAITLLARRYRDHALYWSTVPLLTHELRYEDLRATPLPVLMDSLAFILPAEQLPTLERLACTLELNEDAQAYHSAKRSTFAAWDRFTPALRQEILEITAAAFCRFGYQSMAQQEGLSTGIDCKKLASSPKRSRS